MYVSGPYKILKGFSAVALLNWALACNKVASTLLLVQVMVGTTAVLTAFVVRLVLM